MSFREAFEGASGGAGPHAILSHTDTSGTPASGDSLYFDGSGWVPQNVAWGELDGGRADSIYTTQQVTDGGGA